MDDTGVPVIGAGGEGSSDLSLLEFLNDSQLNCLNEADERGIKRILSARGRNRSSAYLESDTDEQLLMNIYFRQTVKVRSISIKTDPAAAGPRAIKLFTNRPALGFEDVESAAEPDASQILELDEKTVREGTRVPLRYVRFQRVNSLHIFVSSNQGGLDETKVNSIDIFGTPVQT